LATLRYFTKGFKGKRLAFVRCSVAGLAEGERRRRDTEKGGEEGRREGK